MFRAMCGVMLLPLAFSVCLAEVKPADTQLLTAVRERADLRSPGAKPFQLEADFTAQSTIQRHGHFTWEWAAQDLWSQEITMGNYRQLSVRKGDTLYISRNASFTPLRVTQLQDLIRVFPGEAGDWQIKKIKYEVEDGVANECLEIRARPVPHTWTPKRTLCINQATKEVLTDESRDEDEAYSPITREMLTGEARDEEEYSRKAFADYQPFREHSYPRQLTLFIHGIPTLKVKVSSLREISFDETSFDPPLGAVVRRQCEHMSHPEAIKTPDPYIRSSGDQQTGTAIVSLTVLPNGSADNVHLVESAGHEMDQVTQEAVKTWKFKPAMCGTEAVAYDIRVGVTFRGRGSR